MQVETLSLLELTAQPYDTYNQILPVIKSRLDDRAALFARVLSEELPLATARRAYRTAVMVATGEPDVHREYHPELAKRKFKVAGK